MLLRIVQIDRTPKVSWQESPESLTRLQPPTEAHTPHRPSKDPFANQSSRFYTQPFPISKLAPVFQQPCAVPNHPPTPPPDHEADPMDWTPTQPSFQPAPVHGLSQKPQIASIASPFYGRIPAAPQSQAQKLRNPQNQPSFRKTTVEKQQNFSDNLTRRLPQPTNQQNPGRPQNENPKPFEMAPPKFFPRDDFSTDTGLVNLFDAAFSLDDEPPEVQAARERQQQLSYRRESSQGRGAWARIASIFALGAAWLFWKAADTMPSAAFYLRLGSLGVSVTIVSCELWEATANTKAFWSLSDMLMFVTELAVSVFLGRITISHDSIPSTYDTLGMILLGGMMMQEMWLFVSTQKHLPHQSTTETALPLPPSLEAPVLEPVPTAIPPPTHLGVKEPPGHISPSQVQLQEPRMTRSRSKRESFVPATSLSGLSLGNSASSERGSPSETSSVSTTYDQMRYQYESPIARRSLRVQRGLGAFGVNGR